jgi:arginase
LIAKNQVKNISTKELRQKGVEEIITEVFDYLAHCDRIYVSFDVDSLDPKDINRHRHASSKWLKIQRSA